MMAYFVNFIKNGDPNGEDLPEWTPHNKSKKFMVFDEKPPRMGKAGVAHLIKNTVHSKGIGM